MNEDIERKIFNIFAKRSDRFQIYKEVTDAVCVFYDDVVKRESEEWDSLLINPLLNSINNAGCEERRSEQIKLLWDVRREKVEKWDG